MPPPRKSGLYWIPSVNRKSGENSLVFGLSRKIHGPARPRTRPASSGAPVTVRRRSRAVPPPAAPLGKRQKLVRFPGFGPEFAGLPPGNASIRALPLPAANRRCVIAASGRSICIHAGCGRPAPPGTSRIPGRNATSGPRQSDRSETRHAPRASRGSGISGN